MPTLPELVIRILSVIWGEPSGVLNLDRAQRAASGGGDARHRDDGVDRGQDRRRVPRRYLMRPNIDVGSRASAAGDVNREVLPGVRFGALPIDAVPRHKVPRGVVEEFQVDGPGREILDDDPRP